MFVQSQSGSVASQSIVRLNWITGPASRSANQTITGFWNFSAASTQLSGLELTNTASIGGNVFVKGNSTFSGTTTHTGLASFTSASVSSNFEAQGYASASSFF